MSEHSFSAAAHFIKEVQNILGLQIIVIYLGNLAALRYDKFCLLSAVISSWHQTEAVKNREVYFFKSFLDVYCIYDCCMSDLATWVFSIENQNTFQIGTMLVDSISFPPVNLITYVSIFVWYELIFSCLLPGLM